MLYDAYFCRVISRGIRQTKNKILRKENKMQKNKLLLVIVAVCCILLTFMLSLDAGAEAYNWYCMRNKNHSQPRCEPNMNFITNYGGFFVDPSHGDANPEKRIYLTFDAGYENGNIEKILDVLREKDVKAAFFILENLIKSNTDLVVRMSEEGHTVCNHTARHKDMTRFHTAEEFSAELKKLEDVYRAYTGKELARFYRPPEGRFSEENMKFASDLGYKTIFWSFAYADWDNNNQPSREKALKLILDNLHNGEIMLLHPTSATNAAIIGEVIDALRAEGYTFGTLDEINLQ